MRVTGGRLRSGRDADPASAYGADLGDLLGEVARGDLAAFEAVYDRVAAQVFGVIISVVRDPCLSEEVAQEVFVEIWRTAARFDPSRGKAITWVTTIAHRRAIDRVRSEERAAERERRAATAKIPYDDVVDAVEANLDREQVRRCLEGLTGLQREAISLAFYGGHTYREVADLLGVASGTVSTRIHDGLLRLRDCLGVGRR
jgi:RNA polymerase sigma-70 factor (ECF subfamily)